MTPTGPQAINANSTYGVDLSAGNNFGLGRQNRTSTQRLNDSKAAVATKPTMPIWVMAGLVIAAVVFL
jgi:hypothetical protein